MTVLKFAFDRGDIQGDIQMADQIQCANCGRGIGALETTYTWQDHQVCSQCHSLLNSAPRAAAAGQGPAAPPMSNNNYLLAALPHIGAFLGLGLIILPLVMLFAASDEFVRANAREALNFHITILIYLIISAILCLVVIGVVLIIALVIFMFVASIIATVKASQGQMYRYPMTLRMIR